MEQIVHPSARQPVVVRRKPILFPNSGLSCQALQAHPCRGHCFLRGRGKASAWWLKATRVDQCWRRGHPFPGARKESGDLTDATSRLRRNWGLLQHSRPIVAVADGGAGSARLRKPDVQPLRRWVRLGSTSDPPITRLGQSRL